MKQISLEDVKEGRKIGYYDENGKLITSTEYHLNHGDADLWVKWEGLSGIWGYGMRYVTKYSKFFAIDESKNRTQ